MKSACKELDLMDHVKKSVAFLEQVFEKGAKSGKLLAFQSAKRQQKMVPFLLCMQKEVEEMIRRIFSVLLAVISNKGTLDNSKQSLHV